VLKGVKGGFAVGGLSGGKARANWNTCGSLQIAFGSILTIRDQKELKGGFAVGVFQALKEETNILNWMMKVQVFL
jgi:hypothetical protein